MKKWALILGGSSGFGYATAELLAQKKFNLIIVHRDSRAKTEAIHNKFNVLQEYGIDLVSYNTNATEIDNIKGIVSDIKRLLNKEEKINLLLHSIADGNISDFHEQDMETIEAYFHHTIQTMGISFVTWAKAIFNKGLLGENSRIIGITSHGSYRYLKGYAYVGAAKSVLENACRSLAVDLAQYGITTNLISAGITETDAILKLPDYKELLLKAKMQNPSKRLTSVRDIANSVWLLMQPEASWINGEIIRVDGGEQIM